MFQIKSFTQLKFNHIKIMHFATKNKLQINAVSILDDDFSSSPEFLAGPLQKSELQHLLVKIAVLLVLQLATHPFSFVVIFCTAKVKSFTIYLKKAYLFNNKYLT